MFGLYATEASRVVIFSERDYHYVWALMYYIFAYEISNPSVQLIVHDDKHSYIKDQCV